MKNSDLTRVSIRTSPEAEEPVAQLMERVLGSAVSVYLNLEDGSATATVFLPRLARLADSSREQLRLGLIGLSRTGLEIGPGRISIRHLKRKDWAESWKRHFAPMVIASALLIKPSWSRRRARPGQAVVTLDPGLSFGTGQHPTTCFCLEQLVAHRPARRRARSFLDIGTGSGILAIAAAKLGYRPIEGFDVDPDSVRIARANARRNKVDGRLRIRSQDLARRGVGRRRFDLVCANLTAEVLLAEKRTILAQVRPGGTLILAGILDSQFGEVTAAYARLGTKLVARRRLKHWASGAFAFRLARLPGRAHSR